MRKKDSKTALRRAIRFIEKLLGILCLVSIVLLLLSFSINSGHSGLAITSLKISLGLYCLTILSSGVLINEVSIPRIGRIRSDAEPGKFFAVVAMTAVVCVLLFGSLLGWINWR